MSGKKIEELKNEICQARLLNTIGVSRGLGDHHLLTAEDRVPIKPFLSVVPEVSFLFCASDKVKNFSFYSSHTPFKEWIG